jgi:hypothetical protein
MKIRGIDFVMSQVSDLARAAAFCREVVGLPREIHSEEWKWAEFNCGNVTLALNGGVRLPDVIAGGRIALAVGFNANQALVTFFLRHARP